MKRNKKQRAIISAILSFFLAVCIFLLMFCTEMQMGYLGSRTFQDSMLESHYVEKSIQKMKEEVNALLENKGVVCGFVEESIDENECYVVVKNYMASVLDGRKAEIDSTEMEALLETYLEGYLEENGIYQTDAIKTTIAGIVNQAGAIYVRYLQPEFAVSFHEFSGDMKQTMVIVMIITTVVMIVLGVVLVLLYHYKHRAVRYLVISFVSALLWNIICSLIIWHSDVVKGIDVGPEYYQEFLMHYIQNGLNEWWIMSAIGVLLCIVLVSIAEYLKHNIK